MKTTWSLEGDLVLTLVKENLGEGLLFGIISRSEVERRTGGMLKRRTLANLDCLGLGPRRKIVRGKQVGYYVSDVFEFLEQRFQVKTRGN